MHYIHALSFVLHGKFNRFEERWTKQPNYKELTVHWIPLVTSSVTTRTRLQWTDFLCMFSLFFKEWKNFDPLHIFLFFSGHLTNKAENV